MVKKIFMAPVYSYRESRYLKAVELPPTDFPQEKYAIYDSMTDLKEALKPILEGEEGIMMCFGFNKPLGLHLLASQSVVSDLSSTI